MAGLPGEMDTSGDAQPEASAAPAGPFASLNDEQRQLLETIALTFHFDFESLPRQAQRVYSQFGRDKNPSAFAENLLRLIETHVLDDFLVGSAPFLHAATELYAPSHPHLRLQELCEERGIVDEEQTEEEAEEVPTRSIGFGQLYRPRRQAAADDAEEGKYSNPVISVQKLTVILSDGINEPPQRTGQSVPIRSIHSSTGPSTQIPVEDESDPEPEAEPATSSTREPVIPGFVISTRTNRNRTADDVDAPRETAQSRQEYNTEWLDNLLGPEGRTRRDTNFHPYKGWKIDPPQVQLNRALNFLADEDIDRTVDWSRKFAELAEYFSYLVTNYQGEEWGVDLYEAIDMLHTHWVFEKYHYGDPKLKLKFKNTWPKQMNRLPRPSGGQVNNGVQYKPVEDDMGERKLLFNKIRPAHDVHYEMSSDALKKHMEEYWVDARLFWASMTRIQPRKERLDNPNPDVRKFNMVEYENQAFEDCIFKDMQTTCNKLEECNTQQGLATGKQSDDRAKPSFESLRQFSKFRGTRRAALQQCLSQFDSVENFQACTPWRTVVLPLPKVQRLGPIFPVMQVADIPEKDARDPFSYTLGHNWFVKAERYWVNWGHKHSIKEAYGHRKWLKRKEPIMDLPANFNGPYIHDYLDVDMKKTKTVLDRCLGLYDALGRADVKNQGNPRELDPMHYIKLGLDGTDWENVKELQFRDNDFNYQRNDLVPIRIKHLEEKWLRFLAGPGVQPRMFGIKHDPRYEGQRGYKADENDEEETPSGPRAKLFEKRVQELLDDPSPESIFADNRNKPFGDFFTALNRDCGGPVKRWRFSYEEALQEAKALEKKGVLALFYPADPTNPEIRAALRDYWPEDRSEDFRFGRGRGLPKYKKPGPDEWMETDINKSLDADIGAENDNDSDSHMTISTIVSIPKPERPTFYIGNLPQLSNLSTWEEVIASYAENFRRAKVNRQWSMNFFRCLLFRLGKTIRDLREKHEADMRQLTDRQKSRNADFLNDIVELWQDDAYTRANNPRKNPRKVSPIGVDRPTPKYRDVVKMAEPEVYQEAWGGSTVYDNEMAPEYILDIVRKGIIREVFENRSMLFPSRIERRINRFGQTVTLPPRREPVWSFGHPRRRGKVQQFWSIDRWPLHLQSKKTQEKILNSAPRVLTGFTPRAGEAAKSRKKTVDKGLIPPMPLRKPSATKPTREAQKSTGTTKKSAQQAKKPAKKTRGPTEKIPESTDRPKKTEGAKDQRPTTHKDEYTVTYADRAQSRRRFRPGPAEYWLGDTPLQKKNVEEAVRRGLETTSQSSPSWRQRLARLFNRPEEEDDPTALPHVDPQDIPQSKPESDSSDSDGSWGFSGNDEDPPSGPPSAPPAATFLPPPTPRTPSVPPQGGTPRRDDSSRPSRPGPSRRQRRSRPLQSQSIDLEIEDVIDSGDDEPSEAGGSDINIVRYVRANSDDELMDDGEQHENEDDE
ncbi:hypothetical protein FDECE_10419 [Fusarium decemcellulare]|nr:hypothetical protein FDECE_10419 [Fusarium decemcellulare]